MLSVLKFITFILAGLPLPLTNMVGRWLGRAAFALDKKHRDITLNNLRIAFPSDKNDKKNIAVARKAFENLGMNLLEIVRVPWLSRDNLEGYVKCEGWDNFIEAHNKGKGVILITAHLGNWELMAVYYSVMGYCVNIVVRDLDSPLFDRFTRWVRTSMGNRIIPKKRSMRELLRILNRGGIVGILLDQNVTWREGVFVDFFGRRACTNKGPALLNISSAAPVVPTFIVRGDRGHRIIIGEEIPVVNTGDRIGDVLENTQRFTKVIEGVIREYPEHWFWMHQRWKTRPEDDPGKKRS